MGLFDFFRRKKEPEMPEALAKIFKLYFPQGREQQKVLTEKLCQKLNNRFSFEEVTNNYVFVLTCLFMDDDKSMDAIIEKVLNRPNNKLTRNDISSIYNHAVENNEQLSRTVGLLNIMETMCSKGTTEDSMPEGYGEFGLDITNPIPIHGVQDNENYLRKLRLANGSSIKWSRIGSCKAPNIEQIIDNYIIHDLSGNKICNLYLCPYNRKTSNKTPKGFIFEGQKPQISSQVQPLRGKILPSKGVSYVTDKNGEPMMVFYRQSSKLFVNRRTPNDTVGYFLNIRRPLLIDVTGKDKIDLPQIPSECDGIILQGYGVHLSTAFKVRDFGSQTMEIPLNQTSNISSSSITDAYLLVFSATWCGPSKRFKKEIEDAGVHNYSYIDVDDDVNQELSTKYNVRSIPTTILVTKTGEVIKKWVGYDDEDPGQTKFVTYIKTCPYNIVEYKGGL